MMKFHFAEHLDSFEAGIFAILNEKKAVSYTHLDVYKRQCQSHLTLVIRGS